MQPTEQLDLDLTPTCPQCNGPMALRTSQYGDFYSCRSYPNCRGKRSVNVPARDTRRSDSPAPSVVVGSTEQEAIWSTIQNDDCHVVVQALAGTGKSFTCRHAMQQAPSDLRVLYLAFNKSVAQEFSQGAPRNAEVRTLNAIGWRIVRSAFPNAVLDNDKVANILQEIFPAQRSDRRAIESTVEKLVLLCQAYLEDGVDADRLLELAEHHEVELESSFQQDVLDLVPLVLQRSLERPNVVSFGDQLWLPVVLNLPCPKFDLIFLDEAQDLNSLQHRLALRLLAPGGRCVVVGDDHQAIYGFRGSDVDSIRNFAALLEDTGKPIVTLPLTVTRRCPKLVVERAQQYVPEITALPDAQDGCVVYTDTDRAEPLYRQGDMALCRCNAPLISVAFRLIRRGIRAVIRGRDIGQGLITLVQKLNPSDLNDLLRRLDQWSFREISKLAGTRREETMAQQILDRAECLRTLAEDCDSVTELVARLGQLFDNVPDGDLRHSVVLSSIHRAKGLEADRVFWLMPEIECRASQPWQQVQESNLRYVAITRAKSQLFYVVEAKDTDTTPAPNLYQREDGTPTTDPAGNDPIPDRPDSAPHPEPTQREKIDTELQTLGLRPAEIRRCLCGCEEPVRGTSRFLPGHDSRFYSLLARYHVQGSFPGFDDLPEPTRLALIESDLPLSKMKLKKRWETQTDG